MLLVQRKTSCGYYSGARLAILSSVFYFFLKLFIAAEKEYEECHYKFKSKRTIHLINYSKSWSKLWYIF